MEAEAREYRQVACLVEQVQVVQCELLSHWLLHFNSSLIFFPVTLIGSKLDESMTCCTFNCQLDFVFVCCDGQTVGELLQFLANLGEFTRVDSDDGSVLGVWDAQVLNVEGDEVEGELGSSSGLLILKLDLQSAWILISLQGDGILWISKLHHFRHVCDVDSEHHVLVTSVLLESLHAEVERHQSNMTCVHGLQ